jgi:hypothetical protein
MSYIVLTMEQEQVVHQATEAIEVRDTGGRVLARILPAWETAIVEEARRRLATPGPRYTSAEVQGRLQKLNEIAQREELDENRVRELLRKMRAGEEV